MKNILSYNIPLKGAEIKHWIKYHTENQTEYSFMANRMLRFLNILDDADYKIVLSPKGTGCGEIKRYYPIVVNVKN